MFDFGFSEMLIIGGVALVVLGPERLPTVARTAGEWVGKAQRFVAQVKSDIDREASLSELKKIQDEAKAIALQHAGVTEADALYIDIDYDRDDGVNEWSVDFATQDTEYDYEIAAADGSIMKSEREPYRP